MYNRCQSVVWKQFTHGQEDNLSPFITADIQTLKPVPTAPDCVPQNGQGNGKSRPNTGLFFNLNDLLSLCGAQLSAVPLC